MSSFRLGVTATAPLLAWFSVSAALAAESPSEPDAREMPSLAPMMPDLLSGHLQVGAGAGVAIPLGLLSDGIRHGERGGIGLAVTGDVTFGLDRFVRVGGYFDFNQAGSSSRCDDCSSFGYSAGALLKYHFVQGLRVDPWVSYGLGFRALSGERDGSDFQYAGFEWLRLQLGTDWYASRFLGLSPYAQFDAATMIDRPQDEQPGSPDLRFSFGLRLVFDVPGR